MRFINKGESKKIRIGNLNGYDWITIRKNEIVDIEEARGKSLGFKIVSTEGRVGKTKVETKQIEVKYTSDDLFFNELFKINGIGKKTAIDIIEWGTKEKLIETIKQGKSLPFRDDVAEKLKEEYGK